MFTAADDTGCRRLQLEPRFKNKTQNATMWDGKEEGHTLKATEIFCKQGKPKHYHVAMIDNNIAKPGPPSVRFLLFPISI